ncbi:MAG: hypothetical protein PWQ15_1630 [Methanobacterium sp.]|jgi:hypothetical protein|nr:hypothetical protein [Methanobacterium sp.]MDI3550527.1 hypothetical protein [Methanobacterium sp.]CDG64786.1 hypothetical protein MBMB1_0680 [Methanobacterium sp. MB1]
MADQDQDLKSSIPILVLLNPENPTVMVSLPKINEKVYMHIWLI